jgi:hypothetical protein
VDEDEKRDRQRAIVAAVAKVLVVAVAIAGFIGLGTYVVVRSLGLNDTTLAGAGPEPVTPITPLPTTALPVPTALPSTPTPTGIVTNDPGDVPTDIPSGGLYLTASPQLVSSMQRINLTGQWPGHDAVGLLVQRWENGQWVDFGIQTTVNVGTYGTYVQTGQTGDNKFRMYDPSTNTASNPVTVTVG